MVGAWRMARKHIPEDCKKNLCNSQIQKIIRSMTYQSCMHDFLPQVLTINVNNLWNHSIQLGLNPAANFQLQAKITSKITACLQSFMTSYDCRELQIVRILNTSVVVYYFRCVCKKASFGVCARNIYDFVVYKKMTGYYVLLLFSVSVELCWSRRFCCDPVCSGILSSVAVEVMCYYSDYCTELKIEYKCTKWLIKDYIITVTVFFVCTQP